VRLNLGQYRGIESMGGWESFVLLLFIPIVQFFGFRRAYARSRDARDSRRIAGRKTILYSLVVLVLFLVHFVLLHAGIQRAHLFAGCRIDWGSRGQRASTDA
jgi:hypothetical protein